MGNADEYICVLYFHQIISARGKQDLSHISITLVSPPLRPIRSMLRPPAVAFTHSESLH